MAEREARILRVPVTPKGILALGVGCGIAWGVWRGQQRLRAVEEAASHWVSAESFLAEYLSTGKAKITVNRNGQCFSVDIQADRVTRKPCEAPKIIPVAKP